MSKIDGTVIKETKYITVWVIILSVIMEAVFLIIGMWDYKVLLGNIWGAGIAVLNFLLMGITVQKAVMKDEKDAATTMKFSQTMRNAMLLIGAVLGIVLPFFNGAAAIIPFFFPRIAIAFIPLRERNASKREVKNDGE
ncbi:MAG: hypothetical protein E7497_06020 [Ruminococcus sp.]|nr:hypothetical protein [Ruminococcus sp.]